VESIVSAQPLPPAGPFPRSALRHPLERRWLHYAFLTRDGSRALVANIAWLGDEERSAGRRNAILLTHEREVGWSCSQWNAAGPAEPWSSFRLASPPRVPESPREMPDFELAAAKGWPWARLRLQPTSTPGIGGCATFHGEHWQRWQAEPGVLARGLWRTRPGEPDLFEAVGYHERVRGRWGWPEMGGWVFGFCNHAPAGLGDGRPPEWSIVFALLQPGEEMPGQTCVLMLWRRGRLIRFIPRRSLRVTAAGQLERDRVATLPAQMALLGTGPTAAVPAALCLDGYQGRDWVQLRFRGRAAARLVVPSETSLRPYSVHEVIGEAEAELAIGPRRVSFRSPAIVEFAGGATEGSWDVS
jgi:hypothetical protein